MTPENAIKVLVQVAEIAQKGGLLDLNNAATVINAIQVLLPKQEQAPQQEQGDVLKVEGKK